MIEKRNLKKNNYYELNLNIINKIGYKLIFLDKINLLK